MERIWGGGGVLRTILGSPDPISDQKMSKLAYFFFFVTHLSKKDSKPIWLQKGSTPPSLGGKNTGVFFEKIWVSPCVRESKTVLSRFDARDSGFRNICQWNMDTVSQSLVGFLIP